MEMMSVSIAIATILNFVNIKSIPETMIKSSNVHDHCFTSSHNVIRRRIQSVICNGFYFC